MESLPLAKSASRSGVMGVFLNISRDIFKYTLMTPLREAELAKGRLKTENRTN